MTAARWLPSYKYPFPPRGRTSNAGGYGLPWMYSVNQYNARRQGPLGSGAGPTAISPYGSVAGAIAAHLDIKVLSDTVADYDGFGFLLDYPLDTAPNATAQQGWTFDDDAAPPSTGTTIKLQGLTTVFQIATQIALAINLATTTRANVFHAVVLTSDPSIVRVFSRPGGMRANLLATVPDDFNDVLQFNDVTDFAADTPYFFGGTDFSIPARIGPRFAFLPTVSGPPSRPVIIT